MKCFLTRIVVLLAASLITFSCGQTKDEQALPNIIIIMSDDAGYSDIGCFGSEIKTPNLDKMAQEGVRFTNFYSGSKCEPSRSSLFTGLYQGGERAVNLVQVLQENGFHTIHSGKEHFLNWVPKNAYAGEVNDQSLTFWAMSEFFEPPSGKFANPFILNGKEVTINEIYHEKKPFFKTDALTDNALRWMEEPIRAGKPFFLFLGYGAPHYPLQARQEDIEQYRGTYLKGWDKIREERLERIKAMGLLPNVKKLSEPTSNENKFRGNPGGFEEIRAKIPLYRPWDELSEQEKDEMDLEMAVYAAMVDRMDQNIGRVLKKLEDEGLSDNTIIIYLSDNGSCPYDSNKDFDYPPGHPNGFRTLSAAWANAGNTPFRYFKQFGHEGGARVHCILRWPSKVEGGAISDLPSHIVDFFPTLLDAVGIEYPEQMNGLRPQKLQGNSLMPVLTGKSQENPPFIISGWTERFRMYYEGDWKIVRKNNEDWELYNMKEDPIEMHDLASQMTQRVGQLERNYNREMERFKAESEGVVP
jgi:arylsulfatase A-like enzyme